MSEPTSDGKRLIKNWLNAKDHVARLRRELNSAECDLKNNEQALGKWMAPPDAKLGEKICVWWEDNLFQVECGDFDYKVTVRTRGKHFSELVA